MGDKTEGDAEAIDIKNGDIFIAFERNHRVLRYANEKNRITSSIQKILKI